MKTIFIPKGETVRYETLTTDRLVVKGCLKVTYDVKAKTISGNGVISAGTVSADIIQLDELEAATVICKRLLVKRVYAPEVFASDCAVVSNYLSSAYVETGKLTVAISEIDELKADEVVNLQPKKRGMPRVLLASALRSFWTSFTASVGKKLTSETEERISTETENNSSDAMDPELRAAIAETVREIMERQKAEKPRFDVYDHGDEDDFELKRVISTFKLLRDKGYTLRVVPGTPEENAPVFDFDTETILCPAA